MDSKICSNCKKELTIDNFNKKRSGKFGVAAECKECFNKRNNPPNEDINIKQTCAGCGKEFPATLKHFHRQKLGKFGVQTGCKECFNKRGREKNNPPNEDSNIKQTCTGDCGNELPATLEYFHRQKKAKFGVQTECRECFNKRQKEKNNPINTDASIKQTCTDCGEEFPATLKHFHKQRAGKFGVQDKCKECRNKRNKKRNNPPNTDASIKQVCTGECGEEKPATLEFFHREKRAKFGVRGDCKECSNKRNKKRNIPVNTDASIKQVCTDCNKEFPATLEFFHKNKSCKFGVATECKECSNKKLKQWQKDNRDKRREYHNEYTKNKYQNDQQYRIRQLLSGGLWQALNRIGQSKNASILDYIGCDIAFLQQHLNNTKDNSWGDVELHIDHIIPKSLYDHTNKEEIKKCWNWRNLRYFPKSDNSSKGNILDMSLVKQYGVDDLLPDF